MVDSAVCTLSVRECEEALGVRAFGGRPDLVFTGVSTDSRTVGEGELFVALVGDRFDGHEYIRDAIARKAAGIIVTVGRVKDIPSGVAVFETKDTLHALGELARRHRKRLTGSVVGITGSNGKTTTKEITARVTGTTFKTAHTLGNLNNLVGMPMMLLSVPIDTGAIILEMGMNVPGEIQRLAEIAAPDIGVVTNIGPVHLEGVGGIDGVIREKGQLPSSLSPGGVAIYEGDMDYSRRLGAMTRARRITFGLDGSSDVRAEEVEDLGREGVRFRAILPSGSFRGHLAIPGIHNLKNALAAAAVGEALGISTEKIREGIESASAVKMRMEIATGPKDVVVLNDSYNANPASMKAALRFLSIEGKKNRSRSVAVLGDMLELGQYAQTGHHEVGLAAAQSGLSCLFILGQHAPEVRAGALSGGQDAATIFMYPPDGHDLLIRDLEGRIMAGDVVLVKGSRGMRMEKIAHALLS